jgi:PAS domain S-box-containing protein
MGKEERYQRLLEAITKYAIVLLDWEGRVLTWNPGARRITGYTEAEMIGERFRCLYPPHDLAEGKPERVLQAARGAGHYEEEGWRARKDGTQFWAEVVVTPLRDDAGGLMGFAVVSRDIGNEERARDQVALVAERERIGSELQSGTIKVLFAIGLRMQSLAASSTQDSVRRGLQDCINELDRAIHSIRGYVFWLDLRPRPED